MKKVAIVSCYFKKNYGSLLQAYATQKILDKLNIENETINIDENIDFKKGKKKFYKSQILNFPFIKSKIGMIKLKLDRKVNKKLNKNLEIREKKFEEFRNKFRLTKPFTTYEEIAQQCEKYSDVLVGSDQLWLPVNVVSDYYTLNWVPNNINKVSYATSFGISSIPKKYYDKYRKFLSRIDFISVREKNACELVTDISGKDAELVCDPTLLLNKKEWLEIQEEKPIVKGTFE